MSLAGAILACRPVTARGMSAILHGARAARRLQQRRRVPIIESLLRIAEGQQADAMIIEADRAPALLRRGQSLALAMPPLGEEMVAMAVDELLDADEREMMVTVGAVEARRAVL